MSHDGRARTRKLSDEVIDYDSDLFETLRVLLREEGVTPSFMTVQKGEALVSISSLSEVKRNGMFARAGFAASFLVDRTERGLPLRSVVKALKAAQLELEANHER